MDMTRATPYTGCFGVFLRTINQPKASLESILLTTLVHHGGKMELKALIMGVRATVRDILRTVEALKQRRVIALSGDEHDEIISLR